MTDATREQVFRRAHETCEYCRIHQNEDWHRFHVEHVIPKQHGGSDLLENLALAWRHCNHPETVRTLLNAGADVNIQDKLQDNPFLFAGADGLLEVLRIIIGFGADTRITNRYGGTALIPAAEHGHVEVVRELLTTTDVNVNHINNLGWTALLEAVVLTNGGPRHQRIVKMLIDHGADIDIPDKNGVTALQHARKRGQTAIVEILSR